MAMPIVKTKCYKPLYFTKRCLSDELAWKNAQE